MDHRKLRKTRHPGIFVRGTKGRERYVVVYRVNGRQRRETCRTLNEARKLQNARRADVDRGEFFEASKTPFSEYAREWVERHTGRGAGGFRESSRRDYRRDLNNYAIPFLGDKSLASIIPRDLANYVAWLCDEGKHGKRLSDASVRSKVKPVRSCLATAVDEGLIRHNPASNVRLPSRVKVNGDGAMDGELEEKARALTRAQLRNFLHFVNPRHRLLLRLIASTGLRISEALALQWRHVHLNGEYPHVKVRRQRYKGEVGPPKSKHGRRDVPLDRELVNELRRRRNESEWSGDTDLVFPSRVGTPLSYQNLHHRVVKPVMEEVGAPWAGCHALRHTFASMHIARGTNIVQLSRLLGHSSPRITLDVYAHLLDADLGEPIALDAELGEPEKVTTKVTTRPNNQGQNGSPPVLAETAI